MNLIDYGDLKIVYGDQLMNDIVIKGMTASSFLDWDGKIVTTIFLPDCNFRCPFCHNWELIQKPDKFKTVTLAELDRHLRSNRDFLDGVCITGGEPTIYNSLPEFIDHIKSLELKVKLDTNGSNPKLLGQLLENESVDYVAMDIKGPLDDRYNKLAGVKVDLNNIKSSIKLLMDSSIDYEFRTTIVPTLLELEDLNDIAHALTGAKLFAIQQFVPKSTLSKKLRDVTPFSKEELESILDQIKNEFETVTIRGLK